MDVRWNKNGNWFLTASRDHLIKLYDIRNLKQELQVSDLNVLLTALKVVISFVILVVMQIILKQNFC